MKIVLSASCIKYFLNVRPIRSFVIVRQENKRKAVLIYVVSVMLVLT